MHRAQAEPYTLGVPGRHYLAICLPSITEENSCSGLKTQIGPGWLKGPNLR